MASLQVHVWFDEFPFLRDLIAQEEVRSFKVERVDQEVLNMSNSYTSSSAYLLDCDGKVVSKVWGYKWLLPDLNPQSVGECLLKLEGKAKKAVSQSLQ